MNLSNAFKRLNSIINLKAFLMVKINLFLFLSIIKFFFEIRFVRKKSFLKFLIFHFFFFVLIFVHNSLKNLKQLKQSTHIQIEFNFACQIKIRLQLFSWVLFSFSYSISLWFWLNACKHAKLEWIVSDSYRTLQILISIFGMNF